MSQKTEGTTATFLIMCSVPLAHFKDTLKSTDKKDGLERVARKNEWLKLSSLIACMYLEKVLNISVTVQWK